MSRMDHSSTAGVRSYKRVTERLQEMTSNVLNSGARGVKLVPPVKDMLGWQFSSHVCMCGLVPMYQVSSYYMFLR